MKKILPFITFLCICHTCPAQEPEDLGKLREQYLKAANRAVSPIALKYIQQLDLLKSNYHKLGNQQEVAFVDKEIIRIKSMNLDGYVLLSAAEETIVASPVGNVDDHLKGMKGIWLRAGESASLDKFEFKEVDKMVRTQSYPTQGGGISEQVTLYTVEKSDQKLVITPEGAQNPDYRRWFEINIPYSTGKIEMTYMEANPSGSTRSTLFLERKQIIPSASFWQHDHLHAICDGIEPKNSTDVSIPRQSWFPARGTNEWIQLNFTNPRTVSKSDVYWFHDSPAGQCRIPKSARLLYKTGEEWRPVAAKRTLGVSKDRWNRLNFEAVETTALRMEVQLQPNFTGGVLEWRVD